MVMFLVEEPFPVVPAVSRYLHCRVGVVDEVATVHKRVAVLQEDAMRSVVSHREVAQDGRGQGGHDIPYRNPRWQSSHQGGVEVIRPLGGSLYCGGDKWVEGGSLVGDLQQVARED